MPVEDEDGCVSFEPNSSEASDDDEGGGDGGGVVEEDEAEGEDDPPCFLPSVSILSLTAYTLGNTLQGGRSYGASGRDKGR